MQIIVIHSSHPVEARNMLQTEVMVHDDVAVAGSPHPSDEPPHGEFFTFFFLLRDTFIIHPSRRT